MTLVFSLQRRARLLQKTQVLALQVRAEFLQHAGVVGVEVGRLLLTKQVLAHHADINGAKRERFKAVKLAVLGCAVGLAKQNIFNANAVAPRQIHARFIGHHHARHDGLVDQARADAVWAFMHIVEIAHTVAGPAGVVDSLVPQGLARQNVQLQTARSVQEDGRKFVLKPGMSYQVADNAESHRSSTPISTRLFIVD